MATKKVLTAEEKEAAKKKAAAAKAAKAEAEGKASVNVAGKAAVNAPMIDLVVTQEYLDTHHIDPKFVLQQVLNCQPFHLT